MTEVNDDARRVRRALQVGNGVAAAAVSAGLLAVLGAGAGSVPALGRTLVPGHGAWVAHHGSPPVSPPAQYTGPAVANHSARAPVGADGSGLRP